MLNGMGICNGGDLVHYNIQIISGTLRIIGLQTRYTRNIWWRSFVANFTITAVYLSNNWILNFSYI